MKSAEAIYLEALKKKNRNQMILMVTIKEKKMQSDKTKRDDELKESYCQNTI